MPTRDRDSLRASIQAFILEACTHLPAPLANSPVKLRRFPVTWLVPRAIGRWDEKTSIATEADSWEMTRRVEAIVDRPTAWQEFDAALEPVIARHRRPQWAFFDSGASAPLLARYVTKAGTWEYREDVATALAQEWGDVLASGVVHLVATHEVRNLSAPGTIRIGPALLLRPISMDDIVAWHSATTQFGRAPGDSMRRPYIDSWVLEVRLEQRVCSHDRMRELLDLAEGLDIALLVGFDGSFSRHHLLTRTSEGLGGLPLGWGGTPQRLEGAEESIQLKADAGADIESLRVQCSKALSAGGGPLQVAVRRLRDGAGRARADDAIVDFCIGLESLLTASDAGEIAYRFAVRGAVAVASDPTSREQVRASFTSLYRKRSQLVHGASPLESVELENARRFAGSALRTVLRWYLSRPELKSTRQGVLELDRLLLGGPPMAGDRGRRASDGGDSPVVGCEDVPPAS